MEKFYSLGEVAQVVRLMVQDGADELPSPQKALLVGQLTKGLQTYEQELKERELQHT